MCTLLFRLLSVNMYCLKIRIINHLTFELNCLFHSPLSWKAMGWNYADLKEHFAACSEMQDGRLWDVKQELTGFPGLKATTPQTIVQNTIQLT